MKALKQTVLSWVRALSGPPTPVAHQTLYKSERGALHPFSEREAFAALMLEKKSVDLVRAGDAYLWVYRNDNLYKRLKRDDKNINPHRLQPLDASLPKEPQFVALRHVLSVDHKAALFDVGCNYGREAIRIRRAADQENCKSPVFMFDPGVAGKMAQLNMSLNGLTDFEFYPIAISDIDGQVLVHLVEGESQDNKIINRSENARSIPVSAMTLESFANAKAPDASACFLKCDTQGAEFEVMRGFKAHPLYKSMAAVIEFFPNGLATRIKPALFVENLCRDFHVYDLGPHRRFFHTVTPGQFEPLFERIEQFNPPFTDLLLISKGLARGNELKSKLEQAFGQGSSPQ
ncbi:MAG: FkbM family methyltransferase [Hyphococcus sp.]